MSSAQSTDEFVVRIEGRYVSADEVRRAISKQLADLFDDVDRYGPELCGITIHVERKVHA